MHDNNNYKSSKKDELIIFRKKPIEGKCPSDCY